MCVTTDRSSTGGHRRRRRHRRNIHGNQNSDNDDDDEVEENCVVDFLDEAPTVWNLGRHRYINNNDNAINGNPSLVARRLIPRTPQHIATFRSASAASTPPLLFQKKFIIQGTVDGKILIHNISDNNDNTNNSANRAAASQVLDPRSNEGSLSQQQKQQKSQPTDVDDDAAAVIEAAQIVMCAILCRHHNGKRSSDDQVVVLDGQGRVTLISPNANGGAKMKIDSSWETGRPNACSCCCYTREGGRGSAAVVVVGYRDGFLEGWRPSDSSNSEGQLAWRVEASPHNRRPVVSLCPFEPKVTESSSKSDSTSNNLPLEFLLAATDDGHVQVLDVPALEEAWTKTDSINKKKAGHQLPGDSFGVPAEAGREIPTNSISRSNEIVPTLLHPLEEEDGMVLLSSGQTLVTLGAAYDGDRFSWGLAQQQQGMDAATTEAVACQQLDASCGVVGLGKVDLERPGTSPWTDQLPHGVVGLRGGTVYLIPVVRDYSRRRSGNNSDDDDDALPIQTIRIPRDEDVNIETSRFLQGFIAGMLHSEKEGEDTIPVLCFSWPGGVLDVYSCRLRDCDRETARDDRLVAEGLMLREFLRDGSLEQLRAVVLDDRTTSSPEYVDSNTWIAAKKELQSNPILNNDQLVNGGMHTALRQLILDMAASV